MSRKKTGSEVSLNKERKQEFIRELKPYLASGAKLTLEGRKVSLEQLATTCAVLERGKYMRDYISDSDGRLVEIRFDKID